MTQMTIRPATETDLAAIARILVASPEAAQWGPAGYMQYDCLVAAEGENVLGFLVARQIAPDEREILNVAVDPSARRRGVARALMQYALRTPDGTYFLEVRASNAAAIALYSSLGFTVAGLRKQYYHNPAEAGIVMKFNS